ncbi:MAG: 6-carboxytetrahydropterin synthase [Acidobacteriota bacterium]|nr:6-carboxytetrahydropterin synthase [Acidobacteriota bacterium]
MTRRYGFAASHRLHSERFSEAENAALFGKCNNPYGHGHDYEIFVTARGEVDPRTGRAFDPAVLDALVERHVLSAYHHRNMNTDVPEFLGTVPTTENLASAIAARLRDHWSEAFPDAEPALRRVRIRETDRNIFELNL